MHFDTTRVKIDLDIIQRNFDAIAAKAGVPSGITNLRLLSSLHAVNMTIVIRRSIATTIDVIFFIFFLLNFVLFIVSPMNLFIKYYYELPTL